jgi:RNA polymerase sigma-70 factor (ECF subfamily)
MTEQELKQFLQKAQKGDTEAFARIYDEFTEKLYRFIYFRVGQKEVAEDILSDTFVKAWQKIAQAKEHLALAGWLYQIARNNIIDYYRIKKDFIPLEEVEHFLEDAVNPVDAANLSLEQAKTLEVMKELPLEQRKVLQYKFFEDLSNEEIALVMNKTEGAVRVIQHRAILKLKDLMNRHLNK